MAFRKKWIMSTRTERPVVIRIAYIGMMAAIIFIGNYFRIPFMGTKLTVVNAFCVLAGLLFGAVDGFWAAGIGSFLFDVISGYGLESIITFVSKGAIALIAGVIAFSASKDSAVRIDAKRVRIRVILASVLGSFTYVALYMLKTLIMGPTVRGLTMEGTAASMISKFPGSCINAIFASIVAPLLYGVLLPALRHAGLLKE